MAELRKYRLDWPAALLASVALASLALTLTFAPANVQDSLIEWLGWGFLMVSQFTKPLLRKGNTTNDSE